jgi:hypothetical protein
MRGDRDEVSDHAQNERHDVGYSKNIIIEQENGNVIMQVTVSIEPRAGRAEPAGETEDD